MFTEEENPAASDPVAGTAAAADSGARQLRRFIARHNQQAFLLAFFSLLGAAFTWAVLYLGLYWFTLVGITIGRSLNPATLPDITRRNLVSPNFLPGFGVGAAAVLGVAAFLRGRVRLEELRERRNYFLWIAAELFMAVPNITFSIWGNLSAVCRLRRGEIELASGLLRRMEDEGGRLTMASLPLEIQDEKALGRVVFALQLVGLVGVREKPEGWYLYLENRNALVLRTG